MAIKDVIKVNRKTFFDPRNWLGYDALKNNCATLFRLIKTLFFPAQPTRTETFEEAMQRLNLTEDTLKEAIKNCRFFSVMFLLLGIGAFIFGVYLLFSDRTFAGFLLSLAVMALLWSQAFRYDFWWFQLTHRKLGATFAEWRNRKLQDDVSKTP